MDLGKAILSALEQANEQGDVQCIWVALSAGIDSTVLLHALVDELFDKRSTLPTAKITTIKAIHVHHGLSNNADDWVKQAQSLCCQLSADYEGAVTVECIVERVHLDAGSSDGIEQAAREARYQIFEQYCQAGDVLLQGHHLDDQIETFFMRAIRGSGLTGLSGIPQKRNLSRSNTCQILRPFLAVEKHQLIDYAKAHSLSWIEDESNLDSEIDRNWWRNELLPQIWQRYPDKKQSLSRTVNTVKHEKDLLQTLLLKEINTTTVFVQTDQKIHPALKDIPRFDLTLINELDSAVAVSYLRAWLAQFVDVLPSRVQMKSIYSDVIEAQMDAEPSFTWGDKALYRYQGYLFLWHSACALKDQVRYDEVRYDEVVVIEQNQQSFILPNYKRENALGELSYKTSHQECGLKPGDYAIRLWQPGDAAKPVGRSTRKMKKWWQDYGVASWVRNYWPIIVCKATNEVVAVPGLFVCQGYFAEQDGWLLDWRFKGGAASNIK